MNVKRLSIAALALAVTAVPVWAVSRNGQSTTPAADALSGISINGQVLDTAQLPLTEGTLLPMRLLCESDHGSANWYAEENQSGFYLDGHSILVDFTDNSVTVDGTKLDEITATVTEGVTFLPPEVLNGLDGISVTTENGGIQISTSNGLPLTKLAYDIIDEVDMACSMKTSEEDLGTFYGLDTANFDEVISFNPFIVRADTIVIGKYAEGADRDAVKEQLSAMRSSVEQSFEHYLPDPYAMAQAGQVVESSDGRYVMLIISEDNDTAISLFEEGVAALEQQA